MSQQYLTERSQGRRPGRRALLPRASDRLPGQNRRASAFTQVRSYEGLTVSKAQPASHHRIEIPEAVDEGRRGRELLAESVTEVVRGVRRDDQDALAHIRQLYCEAARARRLADAAFAANKDPFQGRVVEHVLERRLFDACGHATAEASVLEAASTLTAFPSSGAQANRFLCIRSSYNLYRIGKAADAVESRSVVLGHNEEAEGRRYVSGASVCYRKKLAATV